MWRRIDDYAEFHFSTVDPETGGSADADATPTYRVYEENNDTAVATGNAAKRDDANTVGYYCVRFQCTTAAGFEVGKEYFCRAQATVSEVVGGTVIGSVAIVPDAAWNALIGGTEPLATSAEIAALESHGDGAWATATGFTVPSDLADLATSVELAALESHGDGAWATATGFSTHSAADVKTAIEAVGSSIASILADTGELQTNQGAWLTATGFSTHSAADVKTAIEAVGSSIALILADTGELQTNQGAWVTATGFSTHSAANVKTALEADGSKLDHLWEMTEDDDGVRRLTENALEEAPSGAGLTGDQATQLALAATNTTWLLNVAEGDKTIDTSTTPWNFVVDIKDTETELIRKRLYQVSGAGVTGTTHMIGKELESAP